MKINEKNLAAFATSATPVDREGWLAKRGEVNKGYQKRWFVLKGNLLFYFEKRGDKEPVGVIILEGCTIELAEDDEQFSFKIMFHGAGNRSYILGAESQESMEQWMKALACASYDYMKLMVADLQRQLDEMEENIPLTTEVAGGPSPQPPPRTRHNPFNRGPATNGSVTHHTRSQSVRSAPARSDSTASRHGRITFRELHTAYGRPILKDRNEWRYQKEQKQKQEQEKELPLITL